MTRPLHELEEALDVLDLRCRQWTGKGEIYQRYDEARRRVIKEIEAHRQLGRTEYSKLYGYDEWLRESERRSKPAKKRKRA